MPHEASTLTTAAAEGDAHRSPLATAADFKAGMRRLAAGVNVITASDGKASYGLTATAVCSLSVEPPHLLICVNAVANAHDALHRAGAFCVNVLSHDQEAIARRFAKIDSARREQRFDLGLWSPLATGAPVLEGALANFDCLTVRDIGVATHTIFIGRVIAVRCAQAGHPLLYWNAQFNGLERKDPS